MDMENSWSDVPYRLFWVSIRVCYIKDLLYISKPNICSVYSLMVNRAVGKCSLNGHLDWKQHCNVAHNASSALHVCWCVSSCRFALGISWLGGPWWELALWLPRHHCSIRGELDPWCQAVPWPGHSVCWGVYSFTFIFLFKLIWLKYHLRLVLIS